MSVLDSFNTLIKKSGKDYKTLEEALNKLQTYASGAIQAANAGHDFATELSKLRSTVKSLQDDCDRAKSIIHQTADSAQSLLDKGEAAAIGGVKAVSNVVVETIDKVEDLADGAIEGAEKLALGAVDGVKGAIDKVTKSGGKKEKTPAKETKKEEKPAE